MAGQGQPIAVIDNHEPELQLRDPVKIFGTRAFSFLGSDPTFDWKRMTGQVNEWLSNDEQSEQREKLALDLLSCRNDRYAV